MPPLGPALEPSAPATDRRSRPLEPTQADRRTDSEPTTSRPRPDHRADHRPRPQPTPEPTTEPTPTPTSEPTPEPTAEPRPIQPEPSGP